MANFDLEDYVTVAERITQFYKDHEAGRINTEICKLEGDLVVIKASVYRDRQTPIDQPSATGHAHERANDPQSFVNKTSHIENAETSAVGRSLALLGYGVSKGLASREEMQRIQNFQQAQPPTTSDAPPNTAQIMANNPPPHPSPNTPSPIAETLKDLITVKQMSMIRALCRDGNVDQDETAQAQFGCNIDELSKSAASELITSLKGDKGTGETSSTPTPDASKFPDPPSDAQVKFARDLATGQEELDNLALGMFDRDFFALNKKQVSTLIKELKALHARV